ncbi:MAG: hypothetical protein GY810_18540 [Aureispira sp.]|nr:hypothetical protein [Aureispira sp.]
MKNIVEINPGEIMIKFNEPRAGKLTFKDLGLENDEMFIESGFLRLVFDLEGIGEHDYYSVPTVEIAYKENMAETRWVCEFNDEEILDKTDHHGHSTVILLSKKKIEALEHRHENKLVIHAEFPEKAHLLAEKSYINLFK